MLTDKDIIRLTTAFTQIFATKDDLKDMEQRTNKQFSQIQQTLTQHDDKFSQIQQTLTQHDDKFSQIQQQISQIDGKVDVLGTEVLEYTKAYFDAHQEALDDHDSRIEKLEQRHPHSTQ